MPSWIHFLPTPSAMLVGEREALKRFASEMAALEQNHLVGADADSALAREATQHWSIEQIALARRQASDAESLTQTYCSVRAGLIR